MDKEKNKVVDVMPSKSLETQELLVICEPRVCGQGGNHQKMLSGNKIQVASPSHNLPMTIQ